MKEGLIYAQARSIAIKNHGVVSLCDRLTHQCVFFFIIIFFFISWTNIELYGTAE